jgi:hypothetical protein
VGISQRGNPGQVFIQDRLTGRTQSRDDLAHPHRIPDQHRVRQQAQATGLDPPRLRTGPSWPESADPFRPRPTATPMSTTKASIAKIGGVSSTNLRHFIQTRELDAMASRGEPRGYRS